MLTVPGRAVEVTILGHGALIGLLGRAVTAGHPPEHPCRLGTHGLRKLALRKETGNPCCVAQASPAQLVSDPSSSCAWLMRPGTVVPPLCWSVLRPSFFNEVLCSSAEPSPSYAVLRQCQGQAHALCLGLLRPDLWLGVNS
jgi:hypothetical protein